jgi:hypothetical protein
MRELATLTLDSGEVLRVDVEPEDLVRDEFLVRVVATSPKTHAERLAIVDEIIASAEPRPAGTTDACTLADKTVQPAVQHRPDRP